MLIRRWVGVVLIAALCSFFAVRALAALPSVNLAWDPSPANDIGGYRLYLGLASQNYATMLDVGTTTNATLSNLTPGTTYFFAVTAYDTNHLESPFSGEISYRVPVVSNQATLKLSRAPGGQMQISGTGPVGHTYSLLWSTDLKNWTSVATVTTGTNGFFSFLDTFRPGVGGNYYRAVQLDRPQLKLSRGPSGQIQISGSGPADYTYSVLWSPDLKVWTNVATVNTDASGSFSFLDNFRPGVGGNYYRALQLAP
jgi:hypothetical protein